MWVQPECTPPSETRPIRCIRPRGLFRAPLAGADERGVLEEGPVGDRVVDAQQVLLDHGAGAEVEMADLRVAHLPVGQADRSARGSSRVCGQRSQIPSKTGVLAWLTAFPGPGSASPKPSRTISASEGT